MNYYLFYKNDQLVGFLCTEDIHRPYGATQVTEEEFLAVGGIIPKAEPSLDNLEKEVKELEDVVDILMEGLV